MGLSNLISDFHMVWAKVLGSQKERPNVFYHIKDNSNPEELS